jgi:hypothetical protein
LFKNLKVTVQFDQSIVQSKKVNYINQGFQGYFVYVNRFYYSKPRDRLTFKIFHINHSRNLFQDHKMTEDDIKVRYSGESSSDDQDTTTLPGKAGGTSGNVISPTEVPVTGAAGSNTASDPVSNFVPFPDGGGGGTCQWAQGEL